MTVIYLVSSSCPTACGNLRRDFVLRVIFSMSEARWIPGVIREHKMSFFPCFIRSPTLLRLFRRLPWNLPRLRRFVVTSSTIAPGNGAPGVVINFPARLEKARENLNKATLLPQPEMTIFAGQLYAKVSRIVATGLKQFFSDHRARIFRLLTLRFISAGETFNYCFCESCTMGALLRRSRLENDVLQHVTERKIKIISSVIFRD